METNIWGGKSHRNVDKYEDNELLIGKKENKHHT